MTYGKYGRETVAVDVDFCDDVLEALDEYALENGYHTREAAIRDALAEWE